MSRPLRFRSARCPDRGEDPKCYAALVNIRCGGYCLSRGTRVSVDQDDTQRVGRGEEGQPEHTRPPPCGVLLTVKNSLRVANVDGYPSPCACPVHVPWPTTTEESAKTSVEMKNRLVFRMCL